MEDDAYPLYNKEYFHKHLQSTICNIHTIDKEWDIISLHIDGPCSDFLNTCKDNYHISPTSGSFAAYVISRNGVIKLANETIFWHIDGITSTNGKYRKYKSKKNLFWTDEKNSTNRENSNLYIGKLLNKLLPLKGEKTWKHILNYNVFRIPIIKKDITYHSVCICILLIILFIIILFSLNINKK
jgi:hypothetical protein